MFYDSYEDFVDNIIKLINNSAAVASCRYRQCDLLHLLDTNILIFQHDPALRIWQNILQYYIVLLSFRQHFSFLLVSKILYFLTNNDTIFNFRSR